ncbi:MAG: type II toxin-antitoxin system HicA family toxin [Candidatus Omnitrophica bacterium]|nr:type II toxin-antitoxin system HicA family toxin [Candidatus Omnitrophota bacterium]
MSQRITPIHYRTLCRIFELAGFTLTREEGDHRIYTKPGIKRPIVIPRYHSIPVFIILNNLKTAGISREEYFSLLAKT